MDLILSLLTSGVSSLPTSWDDFLDLLLSPGGLIACGVLVLVLLLLIVKAIRDGQDFRRWRQRLEEKGWPDRIKTSLADAEFVYSYRPGARTLRYIKKLNPEAAKLIQSGTSKK